MKILAEFAIDAHRLPGGAKRFLEMTKCEDIAKVERLFAFGEHQELVGITLDALDERIDKILDATRPYGQDPLIRRYYAFSESELQSAPLLVMSHDFNEYIGAGSVEGTKYDLTSACSNCGSGALQTSFLYVSYYELPMLRKHRAIGASSESVLVDGGMAKKLRDHGVTGIAGFGEVYARMKKGGRSLVAREQILIEHTMPPQAPSSTLARANACKRCHRGNMSYLDPHLARTVYRREDLANICDFNLSWEWFGWFKLGKEPRQLHLPYPVTLVTPKVMNIFRDAGVTTFEWTPIFVED